MPHRHLYNSILKQFSHTYNHNDVYVLIFVYSGGYCVGWLSQYPVSRTSSRKGELWNYASFM